MASNDFKSGNFSLLGQIDPFTRLVYVSSIKEESTMIKLLNDIIYSDDQYKIANTVFNLIYKDSRYLDYVIKLLDNNLVDFSLIKEKVADDIINNTSWAFNYFLNNLDKLYVDKKSLNITKSFINYGVGSKELYKELLDKTIECKDENVRDCIMYGLIKNNPDISESDLLKFINNDNAVKSKIPYHFIKLSTKFGNYMNIQNIIINNFEVFFEGESSRKMELYNLLSDRVDSNRIKEYESLFRIYKTFESSDVDQILTSLINRNDYYFLDDIIGDKEIKFVGSGTTTIVYRVDDKVIKFTKKKHEQNPIYNKLYLLAPTITKYIPKDDMIMVLEIQDYLSNTCDGIGITNEDIANWNLEMEKLGYVVTDPLCRHFRTDNFGFLKSYKDADIDEKIIDIPEWFKRRPLVLYDIDLIYRKDDEHKKIMKFH